MQVKPDAPNKATLINLLIDYGHVEGLVLCPSDAEGNKVLRDPERYRNVHTIFCNSDNPRTGPSNMEKKGQTEAYWSWKKAVPQPLLSQVRACCAAASAL